MNQQNFRDKKNALETQFLGTSEIRVQLDNKTTAEQLGHVMLLSDAVILNRLVGLGFTGSTGVALALVPVVQVAWADGKIQKAERDAVLGGSGECGIFEGSEMRTLLASWLKSPPQPALFAAWTEFVQIFSACVPGGELDTIRDEISSLAESIAKAAGGILGIGRISKSEEDMLRRVRGAFDRDGQRNNM